MIASREKYRAKNGISGERLRYRRLPAIFMADIRYQTYGSFLIGCARDKMKFRTRYNQLKSQHKSRSKYQ